MCMLFIKPQKFNLPKNYFDSLMNRNKDGLAMFNKNTGELLKTLNYDEGFEYLNKHQDDEIVCHFRYSTSGAKTLNQVHGFSVANDEYLLFHNGVMSTFRGDSDKVKNPRSDTEVFAHLFRHEPIEKIVAYLEKFERGSRFLLANKKTKEYIIPKCANWNGNATIDGVKINFSNSYAIDYKLLDGGGSFWNDYDYDGGYGYSRYSKPKTSASNSINKIDNSSTINKDQNFYDSLFNGNDLSIKVKMLDYLWTGEFEKYDKLCELYPHINVENLTSNLLPF